MKDRNTPSYAHSIPEYMVNGPHLIHLNGMLVNPGEKNDYTVEITDDKSILCWWHDIANPVIGETQVSITRLDTGERWAMSTVDGVYVDTRQ